ncbi:unnamed protein product [Rotaria magnacalcarata]
MSSQRYNLYEEFTKQYVDLFGQTHSNRAKLFANAQAEWNAIKHDDNLINEKLKNYSSANMKRRGGLMNFWSKQMKPSTSSNTTSTSANTTSTSSNTTSTSANNTSTSSNTTSTSSNTTSTPDHLPNSSSSSAFSSSTFQQLGDNAGPQEVPSSPPSVATASTSFDGSTEIDTSFRTPAQHQRTDELHLVKDKLNKLYSLKSSGLLPHDSKKLINDLEKKQKQLEKNIHILKQDQHRKRKRRSQLKTALKQIVQDHPDAAETLKRFRREVPHRPSLEIDQPALLQTILDIAAPFAGADGRRRSDTLCSIKTLDDLCEELEKRGLHISRSSAYLRLLPRRSNTVEGKRHVNTVPVKLVRAQNMGRKKHIDSHFAAASINYLKDLANLFGSSSTLVISQDDKARVPLGLPAAKTQAPILMHLEYRIQLPDHDFVLADRHKLIPSVYAGLDFKNGSLSYSGPTFISIRSGKHDSSTAYSHFHDLKKCLKLDSFQEMAITNDGQMKPIVIIFTDGGPDENPRFPKPRSCYCSFFKENNLDCIFVATNAPGHSAYNPVERRMAPLSHDLSGLILPHDHYGTHLDNNGKTIDSDLEKKNFEKAGEVLAEVWSHTVIDQYPVIADYVPSTTVLMPGDPSEEWKSVHVRQSQYCLQIVRCDDVMCCGEWRTNLKNVLINGFLPPPVPYESNETGVNYVDQKKNEGSYGGLLQRLSLLLIAPMSTATMPFDYYCPSVIDKLTQRTCLKCNCYFPSKAANISHQKIHRKTYTLKKQSSSLTEIDDEPLAALAISDIESEIEELTMNDHEMSIEYDYGVELIHNYEAWSTSEFLEE